MSTNNEGIVEIGNIFSSVDDEVLAAEVKKDEEFEAKDFTIKAGRNDSELVRIRYKKSRTEGSKSVAAVFDYKTGDKEFSIEYWILNKEGGKEYTDKNGKSRLNVGYVKTLSLAKKHGFSSKDLEQVVQAKVKVMGSMDTVTCVDMSSMENKNIILVTANEEYPKNNGGIGMKPVLLKAFDADTPEDDEKLMKSIEYAEKNPVKKLNRPTKPSTGSSDSSTDRDDF